MTNVRQMVRQDYSTGVVEIRHTDNHVETTEKWFVVRNVLNKAKQVSSLEWVSRPVIVTSDIYVNLFFQFKPDVEATELALAFPLPNTLKKIVLSKVG